MLRPVCFHPFLVAPLHLSSVTKHPGLFTSVPVKMAESGTGHIVSLMSRVNLQRLAAEIPGYRLPVVTIYNYDTPEHDLSGTRPNAPAQVYPPSPPPPPTAPACLARRTLHLPISLSGVC